LHFTFPILELDRTLQLAVVDRGSGRWYEPPPLLSLDKYANALVGITIGAVVVPQGMAYATLASLPPQYGLYSSFMGVLIYWFFATSKDITIGVSTPCFLF